MRTFSVLMAAAAASVPCTPSYWEDCQEEETGTGLPAAGGPPSDELHGFLKTYYVPGEEIPHECTPTLAQLGPTLAQLQELAQQTAENLPTNVSTQCGAQTVVWTRQAVTHDHAGRHSGDEGDEGEGNAGR